MEPITPTIKVDVEFLVPRDQISAWFVTPNENLEGATPLQIWNAGYREAVMKLLVKIEVGS